MLGRYHLAVFWIAVLLHKPAALFLLPVHPGEEGVLVVVGIDDIEHLAVGPAPRPVDHAAPVTPVELARRTLDRHRPLAVDRAKVIYIIGLVARVNAAEVDDMPNTGPVKPCPVHPPLDFAPGEHLGVRELKAGHIGAPRADDQIKA